jgi:putative FmdB family regulatory protein
MPVYQFFCGKHGSFEKITIKAEWDAIRCPKCGDKPQLDKKYSSGQNAGIKISTHSPFLPSLLSILTKCGLLFQKKVSRKPNKDHREDLLEMRCRNMLHQTCADLGTNDAPDAQ